MVERARQICHVGLRFTDADAARQEPHPAVDVVADRAGRYHPLGIPGGCHTADRKAITLVDIWHNGDVAHQTWER